MPLAAKIVIFLATIAFAFLWIIFGLGWIVGQVGDKIVKKK